MQVGLDFDNTIACYDLVYRAIVDEKDVVPSDTPANKTAIRDFLRAAGREDEWTELQGYVYGEGMTYARPYPGVADFIATCRSLSIDVSIISHRTRHPYTGPKVDLHATARAWLESHAIVTDGELTLTHDLIHFEVTKSDKLGRIADRSCRWFVDDLPEFLSDPGFPASTRRILFDPHNLHADGSESDTFHRLDSWDRIKIHILDEVNSK